MKSITCIWSCNLNPAGELMMMRLEHVELQTPKLAIFVNVAVIGPPADEFAAKVRKQGSLCVEY